MNSTHVMTPPAVSSQRGHRWQPLSLMNLFGAGDYAGFVLGFIWFALTSICVWWGMVDSSTSFAWSRFDVAVSGLTLEYGFYLPWVICTLLVMWLGLEWAAVPAYLATLFTVLHSGMATDVAVVYALHNPLAMAVYFLCYCRFQRDYSLRTTRSILLYVGASLGAALASSLAALINSFASAAPLDSVQLLTEWLGWWPNALAESLFIAGPVLFVFSPAVERLKQKYFGRALTAAFAPQDMLLAISMFVLTIVLLIFAVDHWASAREADVLRLTMPAPGRVEVVTQFAIQRFVIWLLALMLALISLGSAVVALRMMRQMRTRFDAESRETLDALRRSEANFRNFFENSPAPMFLYDRESGAFVDVNRTASLRYGYSRDEFLSMTIFDIRPPEDVPRLKTFIREHANNQNFRNSGEWRHRTKSGELLDVEVLANPIEMDGRHLNLVLIHDISLRKHAQSAMERRARELQTLAASSLQVSAAHKVEEVLRVASERARELCSANLAVCHMRPAAGTPSPAPCYSVGGKYAGWNREDIHSDGSGIHRLLVEKQYPIRLTRAELVKHPGFLNFDLPKWPQPPLNGLLAVPLTNTNAEVAGALVAADKDEGEFDAEDEAILVQLAQITSAGLENVQLNEALRRHTEELESRVAERTAELDESNRELDAFAYSVAHDLRAPLRAMHGFADALLEDYGNRFDVTGRDYLQRIVKSAKNMDSLIQDLLAYSRLARGNTALEPVSLNEVLEEVHTDLAHEIETRGATVEIELPALTVLAHRATLKQVFLNLVGNAIKFVALGIKPHVRVTAAARNGAVDIQVRDNGIGIAPEHRERIFNVFERLHGPESYPGTGIGLSIVKKGLVRMHGEIRVESDGQGSVFHARLREYRHE